MNESEPKHSQPSPAEEGGAELAPGEEPVVTGTLFLTLIFLMMIFGFWVLFYLLLLDR